MKPLIAMLGILAALGLMVGIYFVAYGYYRKSHPRTTHVIAERAGSDWLRSRGQG